MRWITSGGLIDQRFPNEGSVLKMPAGTQITNIPLVTRRLQAAEMPVTGKPGTDVADLSSLREVPMRKYKAPLEDNERLRSNCFFATRYVRRSPLLAPGYE
jgi:hypothetical protein